MMENMNKKNSIKIDKYGLSIFENLKRSSSIVAWFPLRLLPKRNIAVISLSRLYFSFLMKKVILLAIVALSFSSCYRDVEKIKKVAPNYLKERGYKIVSYDGYECDFLAIQGGFVWYQVKDSDGYLYNLAISEWKGEYQIYSQTCLNAVSNK